MPNFLPPLFRRFLVPEESWLNKVRVWKKEGGKEWVPEAERLGRRESGTIPGSGDEFHLPRPATRRRGKTGEKAEKKESEVENTLEWSSIIIFGNSLIIGKVEVGDLGQRIERRIGGREERQRPYRVLRGQSSKKTNVIWHMSWLTSSGGTTE